MPTLKEFFEEDTLCKAGDVFETKNGGRLLIVESPLSAGMYACIPLYGSSTWRIWWMDHPSIARIEKDYNVTCTKKVINAKGLKNCTIIQNDVTGTQYIMIKDDNMWKIYNISNGKTFGITCTSSDILMHHHMFGIFGDLSKYSIVSAP